MKVTKHRRTLGPFECAHCGLIWYGGMASTREAPGYVLCDKCHNAVTSLYWLNEPMFDLTEASIEKAKQEIQTEAITWVLDKTQHPLPRKQVFDRSVPRWMRSAIKQGMVKTNSGETYVVYSQGYIATQVQIIDDPQLKLKPGSIRE